MTFLDVVRRRQLAKEAANYYRNGRAVWVKGNWLKDPNTDDTLGTGGSLGEVRRWLREHNLFGRNKACGVCAEGALILAFAYDPSLPDSAIPRRLLDEYVDDGRRVLVDKGYYASGQTVRSLPDWNDRRAKGADRVIDVLDAISDLPS